MKLKTILFVDDDEEPRKLVTALLHAEGYRVHTAASVAEALTVAFAEFPDLVITDVIMPGESGYSLCTKLKSDPSTRDIPIVVLTVLDDEARALGAGATAFLSKPIDAGALRSTVGDLLRPGEARAKLELALEELRANKIPEARAGFEAILKDDPKGPLAKWARYFLGQVEQVTGNVTRAIDHFAAILVQDAGFWRAHNRLAMIHEASGEGALALKHYQRSLTLNPDQADVRERMSAAAGAAGQRASSGSGVASAPGGTKRAG